MTKAEKQAVLDMPTIAVYYGGLFGVGLEIKSIEYGINDYIIFVGYYGEKKSVHKARVYDTISGEIYFNWDNKRVPLNECIRI